MIEKCEHTRETPRDAMYHTNDSSTKEVTEDGNVGRGVAGKRGSQARQPRAKETEGEKERERGTGREVETGQQTKSGQKDGT